MRRAWQYAVFVFSTLAVACGGEDAATAGGTGGAGATAGTGATAGAGGATSKYDFSCQATPWPDTAPDPLTWSGQVYDLASAQTIADVGIEVYAVADDALLASTVSDAGGAFSFSLPTGGQALAVYARAQATGYVTSYGYLPFALYQDQPRRSLHMISETDRAAFASELGVALDPATSVVFVHINDCAVPARHPEATVTFAPPGEVSGFLDGSQLRPGDTATSLGAVLSINVPAGPLDVTIRYASTTWRPLQIKSFADAFVYSPRRP